MAFKRFMLRLLIGCVLFSSINASPAEAQNAPSPSPHGSVAADPPVPASYFNDYAGVTTPDTRSTLNTKLSDFDREKKCQVMVAIFTINNSSLPLADYCTKLANQWGVGYKGLNNGVVLFVFVTNHQIRIATGKGMAAILPNDRCQAIINQTIVPQFRKHDFDTGLTSGVDAILDAIKAGPNPPVH